MKKIPVNITFQRFPYPPYVGDRMVMTIEQKLPILLNMGFIFIALTIVKDLVHEKEHRLKVIPYLGEKIARNWSSF